MKKIKIQNFVEYYYKYSTFHFDECFFFVKKKKQIFYLHLILFFAFFFKLTNININSDEM